MVVNEMRRISIPKFGQLTPWGQRLSGALSGSFIRIGSRPKERAGIRYFSP